MDKTTIFSCFVAFFICSLLFSQQITIDNSLPVTSLIKNNLVEGCVELSDIKSEVNGAVNHIGSFGYFEKGQSNFPFNHGIVLSTGDANAAGNSKNTATLNDGTTEWGTDIDLETALGVTGTLNATSVAFNFISASNHIQFNYILASEEYYANFPCDYSDGFAFLIRKANSTDAYINIAVLPGTSTPVNTNTVHPDIVGFCNAENEEYFNGYNLGDTNFNGRTNVLSASANIEPNVLYEIKLVIADYKDKNYDSAVFIEGHSFTSSVNLGEDIQTCASSEVLNADIGNPEATYSWFLNNTKITDATQSNLNVNESGNYEVVIEIPFSTYTCTIKDTINVALSSTQKVDNIRDYILCDDSKEDGIESFTLSSKNNEILSAVPKGNYDISYHYSLEDSENNSNKITTTIQNTTTPQTIYVRTQNKDTGCLGYTQFNLVVNTLPTANQPTDLEVCDDALSDGITEIDLSILIDEIIGTQTDVAVTFHVSQQDAETGLHALELPYTNKNATETLYVRVKKKNAACFSTTNFNLTVHENPKLNTAILHYMDACEKSNSGYATFDLTSIIPDVIQNSTNVNITFHYALEEAKRGENAIENPSSFTNTTFQKQILYVRAENALTGCASFVPIEVHSNLLSSGTNHDIIRLCDIANDGKEDFNLENIAKTISGELRDLSIVFYETQSDRDRNINPLDSSIPYTTTSLKTTLFINITSPSCSQPEFVQLELVPVKEFDSIGTIEYCDTNQDGFININLRAFDADVNHNNPEYSVRYFLTEHDAISNTGNLGNSYINKQNPQVIYTRITNNATGCFDTNSFTINVIPAPEVTQPTPITVCNDTQTLSATIDLTSKASEIITDTTNRVISYYNNLNDARNNTNPITTPTQVKTVSKTFYTRIDNTITGCFTTLPLPVIVNSTPIFTEISNYKICEMNSDGFANFILKTKDSEILNGQYNKTVLYYLNEADAIARVNPINKNTNFQNLSNPQTVFTRIENITNTNCFATSSFIIEVGTNPPFNKPTDWFTCDDISNDGKSSFDLTTKINEISAGIEGILDISFYTSIADAENQTNKVSNTFTNTVNPQTIYAVIDNGAICNSITSFTINVIQVPEIREQNPTITHCDSNYDGRVVFDLTESSVEILDVRQDYIKVEYFETIADLDQNTNPITHADNYINKSNPQTVFVKISNTISDCYVQVPLKLTVNIPPKAKSLSIYETCDLGTVNLNDIDNLIIDANPETKINYFTNETDALNNQNALNHIYSYKSNLDIVYAKLTNTTSGCSTIHPFKIKVNSLPVANKPGNLEHCDDDFDGILDFDLSQQNTTILGSQNPNDYNISYYRSLDNAQNIIKPIPTNYFAINNETIFVRLENNQTGCFSTTHFNIIIHPKPILDIGDQLICIESSPLLVSANTNIATDSYLWSTGETTPEIEISEAGEYSVTVTSINGCETFEAFNAIISEQATIETTETIDFTDPNNITVTVSGIGNYAYALDHNDPQTDNIFRNVGIGYHTLTILDLNGCAKVEKEVVVVDTPKFMTPNNDGFFDTWHITGVKDFPGTSIYIYDRYGKLLKTLSNTSPGWNGTYHGTLMPAADYWYLANVNYKGEQLQLKGHFALKR
ncbi:T9SS type B sorting domain-containing protein [Algibacter pacificus]|uniref:T9SS type B sorting domain-containing protein n=1 Tax=Algibacter pacificus TaxID=2599389 RepID=UPI0011C9FCA0|nr:T9SS type B sorting domain-containing protein [Algibacter pacificus]